MSTEWLNAKSLADTYDFAVHVYHLNGSLPTRINLANHNMCKNQKYVSPVQ